MHWLSLPVSSFRCVRRLVARRRYTLVVTSLLLYLHTVYLIRYLLRIMSSCPACKWTILDFCFLARNVAQLLDFLIVHHVLVENWWCATCGQLSARRVKIYFSLWQTTHPLRRSSSSSIMALLLLQKHVYWHMVWTQSSVYLYGLSVKLFMAKCSVSTAVSYLLGNWHLSSYGRWLVFVL